MSYAEREILKAFDIPAISNQMFQASDVIKSALEEEDYALAINFADWACDLSHKIKLIAQIKKSEQFLQEQRH